ncbi:MAG TPA: magnesium transporter CorA family protein, partial [Candidatus Paceibacterota bacterium]|nr:magnesium transporter CorA family protein [Candidatus Paceibacterota bacterium]
MIQQIQSKISWIDIINPKQSDIDYLAKHFKFHPLILGELIPASSRSKVEIYDGYLFIVYYLPVYNAECQTSQPTEIDFLITKDAVITVRYARIEPIDQLFAKMQKDLSGQKQFMAKTTGHLLYEILEGGLNFSLRQLTHITEKILKAEEFIFKEKEREMIKEISVIKRDILDQRQITRPQKSILESLLSKGTKFFGKDIEIYFNDLLGDYEKIWDALDNLKETAEALEETNNTLFDSKTNNTMKVLTVTTFIVLPLSLITSIFGLHLDYMPFANHPLGFWIILAIMLGISFIF